jgi:hypothetical protein
LDKDVDRDSKLNKKEKKKKKKKGVLCDQTTSHGRGVVQLLSNWLSGPNCLFNKRMVLPPSNPLLGKLLSLRPK